MFDIAMRVGAGGELENAGRSIRFSPPGYEMIFKAMARAIRYTSALSTATEDMITNSD
jgi:hypothetical protein